MKYALTICFLNRLLQRLCLILFTSKINKVCNLGGLPNTTLQYNYNFNATFPLLKIIMACQQCRIFMTMHVLIEHVADDLI